MPLPFYPQTPGLLDQLGGYQDPTLQGMPAPTPAPAPPPQPAAQPQPQPGLLERLAGPTPSYGGLLDPSMQKSANNQFLLNLGAGLLAGSGSGQRFGAILGQSLQGAAQAKRQAIEDQIKSMLLQAQIKKGQEETKANLVATIDPATGKPVYTSASQAAGKEAAQLGNTAKPSALIEAYQTAQAQGYKGSLLEFQADLSKAAVGAAYTQAQQAGQQGVIDKRTGTFTAQTTLPQEANAAATIAGAKAVSETTGKNTAMASSQLPQIEQTVSQSIDAIDKLKASPGLRYITGIYSKAPVIPGTSQADAAALAEQVQGQTFLQAYQSLKGGGQITEVEGKKAEQAIGRLQRGQSTKGYQQSLDELRSVLDAGLQRARQAASGGSAPQSVAAKPNSGRVRVDANGNVVQ